MLVLFKKADNIEFVRIKNDTFTDNRIMVDSALPQLYREMFLLHYRLISDGIYDCELLASILSELNPLNFNRKDIYKYKIKKMITAAALGMTPGKAWDGMEAATGGYIIIKKDGDVLCYHLYNRNHFEEYLIKNTQIDRPSASRYDYGYLYKEDGEIFIDLNVQIRFKSIKATRNKEKRSLAEDKTEKRIMAYINKLM